MDLAGTIQTIQDNNKRKGKNKWGNWQQEKKISLLSERRIKEANWSLNSKILQSTFIKYQKKDLQARSDFVLKTLIHLLDRLRKLCRVALLDFQWVPHLHLQKKMTFFSQNNLYLIIRIIVIKSLKQSAKQDMNL